MNNKNELRQIICCFMIILSAALAVIVLTSCKIAADVDVLPEDADAFSPLIPEVGQNRRNGPESTPGDQGRDSEIPLATILSGDSSDLKNEPGYYDARVTEYPFITPEQEENDTQIIANETGSVPQNTPGFSTDPGNNNSAAPGRENETLQSETPAPTAVPATIYIGPEADETPDDTGTDASATGEAYSPETPEQTPHTEFHETVTTPEPGTVTWNETTENGVTVRTDYVYPEGVVRDEGGTKQIDVGEDNSIGVVSIPAGEGLRVDYRPSEKIISDQVKEYLIHQTVSNEYSHITSTDEIPGTNFVLEGLPFYYIPGYAPNNVSKIVIDYDDIDGNGILACVYEKCEDRKAKIWGMSEAEASKDYLCAVYVDVDKGVQGQVRRVEESVVKDYFYERTEDHLGVNVTRMAENAVARSDYFFLAFPLLNGKYVINIAGGVILLSRAPETGLNIFFNNGGGDLGFYDLQISVDEAVVFECDCFNINSTSVITGQY